MLSAHHPFSFILFGASGHLAKIKIFPALYFLALKKRLPKEYVIMGYARTAMTDAEFRAQFADAVTAAVGKGDVNQKVLKDLLAHVHYHSGQYTDAKDFKAVAKRLEKLEKGSKGLVRIAYLSIPPTAFTAVLRNLCEGGVHQHGKKRSDFRCIVEKPVGHDQESFHAIREHLYSCFTPSEVYILDHYLGKEAVRNVFYLRYANPVIEHLLKNSLISHVQITASETHGLEGRAGYFDAVGTLRDMFQSHLLQITALLTMRLINDPAGQKAARLDALKKLYIPHAANLDHVIIQGQYGRGKVNGKTLSAYQEEQGVSQDSRASTYIALRLVSRSSRWDGVPFYLRSGKRLQAKETRISIEFQESLGLLGKHYPKNRLDIILQGEAGMKLYLQTKIGGEELAFRPLVMEDPLICMGDCLVEHSLLLLEIINGNQQWFLDPQEVETCWHIIDPLQTHLDKDSTPLHIYPSGSTGPKEAEKFIERFGQSWF